MSQINYLLTLLLPLGTLVLVFAFKYLSAAYQAHMRSVNDARYQDFARGVAEAQVAHTAALAALQAELSQVSQRLAQVARILQEVE